jgi:hypothetical protein
MMLLLMNDQTAQASPMESTIQIKIDALSGLRLKLTRPDGLILAATQPFRTICRLEDALSTLAAILANPASAVTEQALNSTAIKAEGSRRRIHFEGALPEQVVNQILQLSPRSIVVDGRPPTRRRFELSGKLCDLAH